MENSELEDLDQLVTSAGWMRFKQMVAEEWGEDEGSGKMFATHVKKAANLADVDALPQLRQIMAAQREIQKVMRAVEDRVKHLKTTQPSAESDAKPLSRRGIL